jgi:hypothetical protein
MHAAVFMVQLFTKYAPIYGVNTAAERAGVFYVD